MKNLLFLLTAFLLFSVEMMAQTVPQGMRFQAIARDLNGSLLLEKSLIVKVELLSAGQNEKVFYTETHEVSSSKMGELDFVIGEGAQSAGKFSEIPWSTEEMWVRISVKIPGEESYQIISSGQLYSVPYALYADKAGSLVNKSSNDGDRGLGGNLDQTSIYWTLDGNANSHKYKGGGQAVIGTTDRIDLTMITKNIPRLIIDKDGNINILVSISINGDLNVDGNTTLNGSLDVTNMKPTHFSGTLTVDKATTLNDALDVMNIAPTQLSGLLNVDKTLNVKGATTLNNTLDVTNSSATYLSGTLITDKATTLNSSLTVKNMAPTQLTGALDVDKTMNVDGATTLNKSLDVSGLTHLTGTLRVDQATTLKDAVTVTNIAPTQLTGLLDVDKTLNVDGATTLNSTLDVTASKATHLSGILNVDKATTLKDSVRVTNGAATHLTGDLDVDGAVLMNGDIALDGPLTVSNLNPSNLTGTLEVAKLATLKSGLVVTGGGLVGPDGKHVVFFDNTEGGSTDGIAIKLGTNQVSKENNFMTFYRGNSNTVAGRIEGHQFGDITAIPVPTSTEIWGAVCLALANYNPITIVWTQFAGAFNTFSYGWNNLTIPSFDIPDVPPFVTPDVPPLTIPNIPSVIIPNVPGFITTDIPGFVTDNIPALNVGPYLCVPELFECPCCVCFDPWDCSCGPAFCAIPAFQLFGGLNIPDFAGFDIPNFNGIDIPDFPGINVPDFNGIDVPNFPGIVIPATPSINLKNLFGTAPTIPTFNDILVSQGVCPNIDLFEINNGYVRRVVDWAIENRIQDVVGLDPVKLLGNVLSWGLTQNVLNNGTVYGSKGADYAEYLPKVYATEQFMKGDVVGVYNGRISKNTKGADQILAITSQPLVLGNTPDQNEIADFEKVAFLGQIPVYVKGPVNLGDFIVPSGNNDGIAKAIPAGSMTAEMLSIILGKAWSDYSGEGITLINTSIGLRPMEISLVLKKQGDVEDSLQAQLEHQRADSELISNDVELMKRKLGLSATSYNP